MSSLPAVPPALPVPEDQLAVLRRLLAGASPAQRQFLAGYVAGFQAALDTDGAAPALAAPSPAAPPAARPALTVLYATESGNAEALAGAARKAAGRLGFAAKLLDMADADPAKLAGAANLLVIASTWGEGDPPQRAEPFYAALMDPTAPRLDGVRFAVLALGDRAYVNFCETGRRFDQRLEELGGIRIADRVDCDLDFAAPARTWTDGVLKDLAARTAAETPAAGAPGSAVIHVDFARSQADDALLDPAAAILPRTAEITELVNLNSSRSSVETHHLELSLAGTGLTYHPGDAIGFTPRNDPALVDAILDAAGLAADDALGERLASSFDIATLTPPQVSAYATLTGDTRLAALAADPTELRAFIADRQVIDLLRAAPAKLDAGTLTGLLRPLQPRLYSVASAQSLVGEEAHLLIGRVRWQSHGIERHGVASGMVAARRRAGDTLDVYVKPNPHFRLPAEAERPVVMIGPGTGVAPFRGFLQHREATGASGPAWLFFGARQFTHDFLYQLEWQDWLKSGVLARLDVAFSRDQPERIHVQTRMWEARRELYAWIRDGAALYVCGDAKAMAKDVHAMLVRIIAEQGGHDEATAQQALREMQQTRRYQRDVY
jgi:sulfite reductase (NADPH) flavoprotein alpha-component